MRVRSLSVELAARAMSGAMVSHRVFGDVLSPPLSGVAFAASIHAERFPPRGIRIRLPRVASLMRTSPFRAVAITRLMAEAPARSSVS